MLYGWGRDGSLIAVPHRLAAVATAFILVLFAASIPTADALAFTKLRLCYFYFGTIDDLGWTFTYNAGRVATHEALLAAYPTVEIESVFEADVNFTPRDRGTIVNQYISSGCHVLLTNNDRLFDDDWAARAYPNVSFVLLNNARPANTDLANRVYLAFDYTSVFYVAGAAAATEAIGCNGSVAAACVGFVSAWQDDRNPNEAVNGFILGVRSVSESLPIDVITMESWYSPLAEERAAKLLLSRGCGVIARYTDPRTVDTVVATTNFSATNRTSPPLSIGTHANLQQYVGDTVLLAIFPDWSKILIPILSHLIETGTLDLRNGTPYVFGLASGVIRTSPVSPLARRATERAVRTATNHVQDMGDNVLCGPLTLRNGTVVTPTGPNGCATLSERQAVDKYLVVGPGAVRFHDKFQDATVCTASTWFTYGNDTSRDGAIELRCVPCGQGTFSTSSGSASCSRCPDGWTSASSATVCTPRPNGEQPATPLIAGLAVGFTLLVVALAIVAVAMKYRDTRRPEYAPRDAPLCVLFTSVENGARLWQDYPTEMNDAIDTHHRVIREVLKEQKAYEVRALGDSFMIATRTALDGMLVATKIQVRLQEAEWPSCFVHSEDVIRGLHVRIGVHMCRDVHVKYEQGYYDYYGNDVNAAARIESLSRGGQILIDQRTFTAARKDRRYSDGIEREVDVRTFAAGVTLKGMDEMYTLFSVLPNALAARTFAPLAGHEECGDDDCGNNLAGSASTYDLDDLDSRSTSSRTSQRRGSTSNYARRLLHAQLQPFNVVERAALLKSLCKAHGLLSIGKGGDYQKTVAALATAFDVAAGPPAFIERRPHDRGGSGGDDAASGGAASPQPADVSSPMVLPTLPVIPMLKLR
jgi:class 3 adenylate cyclase/basic membrane lipoprotein Med (substrate-binding protein (PBP1-ABC) superfamily)